MQRATLITMLCLLTPLPAAAFNFDIGDAFEAVVKAKKMQQQSSDATTEISEPKEVELGDGIASTLLGAAPLYPDARVQKYVNDVGRWLSLQTERPDLPWEFGVLDNSGINAFATPGGRIFITKGLLLRIHSESELAGVLAHEIAHVLRKHHLNAIKKGARIGLAAEFANMAIEHAGVNSAATKLVSAGTELYTRGLDKGDELQADRMGVIIAARAGYDPYGLPAVLQNLQLIDPKDSSVTMMFKTHPPLDDRLDQLDKLMSVSMTPYENQPDLESRFKREVVIKQ